MNKNYLQNSLVTQGYLQAGTKQRSLHDTLSAGSTWLTETKTTQEINRDFNVYSHTSSPVKL